MDPITWIYLIVMVVALVVAVALMPTPKSQPPASLSDFNVPTAEDGREVVDVCGTVWIDDPNVIWYGDMWTQPVYADGGK